MFSGVFAGDEDQLKTMDRMGRWKGVVSRVVVVT